MEKLHALLRVKKIDFADPISQSDGIRTADWKDFGYTLQDDTLQLSQDDPQSEDINVNELDTPADVIISGGKKHFEGTLVDVLGGTSDPATLLGAQKTAVGYELPAGAHRVEVALRVTDYSGGVTVCPRAVGYVKVGQSFNAKSGRSRYPFHFDLLAGSPAWQVDMVAVSNEPDKSAEPEHKETEKETDNRL